MASQTRSAGLGQNINNLWGVVNWQNPTNIYTSNNEYSHVNVDGPYDEEEGEISHYLRATSFGFTIPTGATIDGIKVEYERKSYEGFVEDDHIYIVKAGTEQGTNKAGVAYWSTTESYVSYGGTTDKWGLTWAASQINASNFGVSVNIRNSEEESSDTAYVDHIRITVYYTIVGINMKIKASGAWKGADALKIVVGGAWKPGVKAWQVVGGVWKVIFG